MSDTLYILTFNGRPTAASFDENELKSDAITRCHAFYPPLSEPAWVSGKEYGRLLVLNHHRRACEPTPYRIASVTPPVGVEATAPAESGGVSMEWTGADGTVYPLDHELIDDAGYYWRCHGWLVPLPGDGGEPVPHMYSNGQDHALNDSLDRIIENSGPVTVGAKVQR